MDVFDLVAKLTLDTSEYDKELDNAENSSNNFGKTFGTIMGTVGTVAGVAGVAISAVGGAVVGTTKTLVDGATDVAAYGDNIDKMSQKMGISIEAYQEWDAVMQHSGTSMESMKASMKTLANAVENGNEAFEKIGLSQEALAEMSQEEIFEATISGLQNIEDTTQRTYLAGQLLGRGATELGALLNYSAEETQAMRDRVRELGGVLSEDAVKAAAGFQDNLQDLQTAFAGIKRGITADLLPGISSLMDGFTRLISGEEGADEAITSGIDDLMDGIESAGGKIVTIATEVIPRVVEGIANRFPDLVSSSLNLLSTVAPQILNALISVVIPTLLTAIPQIFETALTLVVTLANGIADGIPTLIPTIIDVVLTIVNVLLDNIDLILDVAVKLVVALLEGILGNLDKISLAATEIMYTLIFTFLSLIPQIIAAAFEIIYALFSSLASGILKMLTADFWIKSIEAIIHAFTDIDWGGIAMRCLEGIANGFTKGVSKVVDSAKNVVDSIKNVFTNGLEIHSPSKLFEYYGDMIDKGLAAGIDDGQSVEATKDLSYNIGEAFNPNIGYVVKSGSDEATRKMVDLLTEQNNLLWQILNKNYGRTDDEIFSSVREKANWFFATTGNYAFGE